MEKELLKIFKNNDIEIKGKTAYECINVKNMTLRKLKNILLVKGTIDYENVEERYYIGRVNVKRIEAAFVVRLENDKIEVLSFAREGLLKRNISNMAIEIIRREVESEN